MRYGLTSTVDAFNPAVIATHEWRAIAADVAGAPTWTDRFGFLLRGPGWAYRRREELAAATDGPAAPVQVAQPVMG